MVGKDRQRLRAALPDEPRWAETRDLLSDEVCPVHLDPAGPAHSYIVVDDGGARMASVVGRPRADLIRLAVSESGELLAFSENIDHVRAALPTWSAERALLHVLPDWREAARPPAYPTRYLRAAEVGALAHVASELRAELQEAADEGVEILTALDGSLPVAFCYAGATTETLWDVAIDTARSHRRRGFAESVALGLIQGQAKRGLAPVWGAVESNTASLGLARKLGFVEVDMLWVLTPDRSTGVPSSA